MFRRRLLAGGSEDQPEHPKTLISIVAKANNDDTSLDLQYLGCYWFHTMPEDEPEKAEKADKRAAKVHKKRVAAILREIAERVRETTEGEKKFAEEIKGFPVPSAPSAPSLGAGVMRVLLSRGWAKGLLV
ncbi:hypothetical protein PG991_014392 [Apiospora marii]|uniref:Uncharacterized protein n=1 Tax=Apiospora marii TaxID=335849 RepID=A0ABR1R8N3_9PEZI